MADLTGRRLGQYEIVERIGRGGMADVYRAVQPPVGREVAIKVLPPEYLRDPTFLERFNREVQVIARLEHPRILPVYDFGEQDGLPFIVMRYLPGGSLADLLRRWPGGMMPDEVVRLVGQIAEGLDFAHERGVIHRDFKPSNVLLDMKGNIYLADFGIARVVETTTRLTGSGVVGTPTYMAPEMSRPGGMTPLVDVYALGVTVYQMLTGRAPYEADTPIGVLMAHAVNPIPDVHDLRPDLPGAVQQVIERGMAKDPADRYRSAGELAADLQAALVPAMPVSEARQAAPASAVSVTPTMDIPAPLRPVGRRLSPAVWIGGVVLLVCGAAAVIALLIAARALSGISVSSTQPAPEEPAQQAAEIATATHTPLPTVMPQPAATVTPQPTAPPGMSLTPFGGGMGQIAFTSMRDGNWEVYVMAPDGSGPVNLTNNPADDGLPARSPDGTRIAFVSDRGGAGNPDIYLMDPDGSNITRLTSSSRYDGYPVWSPDGTRIAFVSSRDGNMEIYVMNADGSNQTRLTNDPEWDSYPTWSPDGTRIAFATKRDGNQEIYVMDASGTGLINLTNNAGVDVDPAWSPDGTQIAFQSDRDGNWEIYVMDASGANPVRLTDNPADDWSPNWSPDGLWIVFSSKRDGNMEVYVMAPGGSGLIRLTDHPADDGWPTW